MSFRDDAAALADDLTAIRHDLHRHPELGLELPRTQQAVLDALAGLPLEITTGQALSSVTAVLRGTSPDRPDADVPTVLLRGDMDALPMPEETGVDFSSEEDGVMHGCGHDLHVTMLIGAARMLSARRDELPGDVVFMFQPGEEGCGGAEIMIREGVLEASGRKVDAAYGMHVFAANIPHGVFTTRPGPMLAAVNDVTVTIRGAGGHSSAPHHAIDPVTVACQAVVSLQTMVTRRFNVFDPVVVGVGRIQAGEAANVIPDTATFWATVRTFSAEHTAKAIETVREVVRGTASAFGATAEFEDGHSYPVTANHAEEADFVAATAREVFGEEGYEPMADPISGAEDFSFVLNEVPGAFFGLGACFPDADPTQTANNHSPRATYDDSVLPRGAALYSELAHRKLRALADR